MSVNSLGEVEDLIVLDENDEPIGRGGKRMCHKGDGLLHRAFSLLLFDKQGRILVQKRSAAKPLWPGFWSNSCCSHPRPGEKEVDAAVRRAREELGVQIEPPQYIYKFKYKARYLDVGTEHEWCYVFLGRVLDEVRADPEEIEEIRFMTPNELRRDLMVNAFTFTPWFRSEWELLERNHETKLYPYFRTIS